MNAPIASAVLMPANPPAAERAVPVLAAEDLAFFTAVANSEAFSLESANQLFLAEKPVAA